MTTASSGSVRSRLVKIYSIRSTVTGALLGHLVVGGAKIAAPVNAALTCILSMLQDNLCRMYHAQTAKM